MAFHLLTPMMSLLLVMPQQTPDGVLRGVIRSTEQQMPVEMAAVEVLGPEHLLAWTDRDGRYELHGVEAGVQRVLITHAGHEPMELDVRVPPQGTVVLDVTLQVRPVRLAPLHALGDRWSPGEHAPRPVEPVFGASTMRAMEGTPGVAELGLTDVLYGGHGDTPPGASDALFIRGSTTDLKLVLLDGAPIYAPFHLGGLLPAFSPDVLQSSSVRFGGASARYDGGLAYILDLETRQGSDAFHSDGSLDMMSAQGTAEGSLGGGRVHMIASARGIHGAPMERLLGEPFPYRYGDGLARLDVDVSGGGRLSTMVFGNAESVSLGDGSADRLGWDNNAFSVRYDAPMGDSLDAHLTVAYGGFSGRLPPMGASALVAEASAAHLRLVGDFDRRAGPLRLHYGGSFERLWLDYMARQHDAYGRTSVAYNVALGQPVAALYADGMWVATPQLTLHAGLRANLFGVLDNARLAPRASVAYRITDAATMTFSAGRFYQYLRTPELQYAFTNVYDSPAPMMMFDPSNLFVVGEASHYVVGLDQTLSQTMRLQLDASYRHLAPPSSPQGASISPDTVHAPGIESSGVDIWLRRAGNNITGWLGYSLGWTWSAASNDGVAQAILAGRHLLSVGLAGALPGGAYLSVRVNYGAGLPLTAVTPATSDAVRASTSEALASGGAGTAVVEPSATYLRLDAELSRTWSGGGERRFEVTPYFRILNALDRRDALFYRQDGQGLRAVGSISLIPVLGLAWRF
ncbi:MAG TPA: carboxypeptidase regulatory-like domain-containing protein [Longimicrobiales bacterium]|nr:carboxypeptidase regulatory-like domain-containing protein [Longimicrobiales bacterium]